MNLRISYSNVKFNNKKTENLNKKNDTRRTLQHLNKQVHIMNNNNN
jgi:hypothetical protein